MRSMALAALALTTASSMAGSTTVVTLDFVAPSGADITVEYFTYLGTDSVGAVAEVTGSVTIEADQFGSPSSLILHDISITVTPAGALDLNGTMDAGEFLGEGSYTLDFDGVEYNGLPISSTGGINTGLALDFPAFEVSLQGNASTSYNFIGLAPVNMDPPGPTLDSFGAASAVLSNVMVNSDGNTITLEGTLTLDEFVIPWETALVETRLNGTINIVAMGEDSSQNVCSRADIAEPCGLLDLADVLAFSVGFMAMEPISDFNNDGLWDLSDVLAFSTAFLNNECMGDARGKGFGGYDCYYVGINFDEGDAAYALGEHSAITAGIAVSGACLMLGLSAARRRFD